jgi:putative transposase
MAEENRDWGYDRIAGALGYKVCDQTIGNGCNATVCRRYLSASARPHGRHSFVPTWRWLAGTDFFAAALLTLRRCAGLVTYYVLFFIHLESHQVGRLGSPFTWTLAP